MESYKTADVMLYDLLIDFAKHHRKFPTEAESVLWERLRRHQLGVAFRRQHVIGMFIADFVCLDANLIVEVDGGYHQLPEQQISDEDRTSWLNKRGYRIIRFTNEQVLCDIDNVIREIKRNIL